MENCTKDDMPLRTIKTILSEIVSLKGNTITNHLTLVPLSSPPPAIISYINLMLQTRNPNHPTQSQEIKSSLTEIFKKIGTKETTQEGLYDLYQFKKDHVNVDLQPHLQRASEHFQDYIKRGLMSIELQYSSENTDPNSTSNADHFAVSYLYRLHKLQSQYGIKNDEISTNPPISIDPLRTSVARLRSTDTQPAVVSDVYAEEVHTLGQQSTRRDDSGESTMEELRHRLAKLKNAM